MNLQIKPKRNMIDEPLFIKMEDLPEIVGSVKTADGKVFPAQKKDDGIVIIAEGKREEEIIAEVLPEKAGIGVEIVDCPEKNALEIFIGGKLFTSYVYNGFIKPFIGHIYTSNGDSYTRFDPEAKEHPHHRSVFIAVGDVNGIDFWNERENRGEEHHQGFENIESGNAYGSFTAKNIWTSIDGIPQIDEKRTITFYAQNEKCRYIDIETTFTASYGDVVFGPTKEAGPLGIRVNESMRADRGGCFNNSYGGENESECWGRAASWCDYHGEINGKKYGIAAFDNEDNERYPTTWHIRNYGLFAANNLYFKGGFTINKGENITYRHRICFYENEINTGDRFILYSKDSCGK